MRLVIFLFFFTFHFMANASGFNKDEQAYLEAQLTYNILENGAVIASPIRHEPNYYYHWVRDAALSMRWFADKFLLAPNREDKKRLKRYVSFVEIIQSQPAANNTDILGEPKFNVDGTLYHGPWGRPQNDGPALRAITLVTFAQALIKQKETDYINSHLYHPSLDFSTMGVIKRDLEYIAHHWQEPNFDLWEEVYGQHFFTLSVQMEALIQGAELATKLNDVQASEFYQLQAEAIKKRLNDFVDKDEKLIHASLLPHPGPQKDEQLDSAILLAVLYCPHHPIQIDNQILANTVKHLKNYFDSEYPINQQLPASLYGRYPGDTYDGYQTNGKGNPWPLISAAVSEYHFRLAESLFESQDVEAQQQAKQHLKTAQSILEILKYFAPKLILSEQLHREVGTMEGAIALSWSYLAVLRASSHDRH